MRSIRINYYSIQLFHFSKKSTDALKLILNDPPYNASDKEKVSKKESFDFSTKYDPNSL